MLEQLGRTRKLLLPARLLLHLPLPGLHDRRHEPFFIFIELPEFGCHRPTLLVQLTNSGEYGITHAFEREHLVDDGLEHRWKPTLPHAVAVVPANSRGLVATSA